MKRSMTPNDSPRTANLLGALALALGDGMRLATDAVLPHSAMAPAALTTVAAYPGESLDALRRTLQLTPSGTTRLLDNLQRAGLIERRPGRDARSVALFPTAKGVAHADAILSARREVLAGALKALDEAERTQLEGLLEKILRLITTDRSTCDHICRLCEIAACPQHICPVELAAIASES